MKKYLCALLCMVFLLGCSGGKAPALISEDFTYRAHIFYYGQEYECIADVKNKNQASFTVCSGESEGFCAAFSDDKVTYSYGDTISFKCENVNSSMLLSLYELNKNMCDENVKKNDGQWAVAGNTSIGEFKCFVSGTGLPLYCELDGKDFYVEFYDAKLIK